MAHQNTPAAPCADGLPYLHPEHDGTLYINMHVKGTTELGRLLAHFAHTPFVHPIHGSFYCMEGFWQWLKCKPEERPDSLRYSNGAKSRNIGKDLNRVYVDNFQQQILEANYCRIEQNPELKEMLLNSSLPFELYYMNTPADDSEPYAITAASRDWLTKDFDTIRTMMQYGERPEGLPKYLNLFNPE